MILIDQTARDNIIKDTGNVVISASAGSGKTTIMIKKMKKVLDEITNHKTVAAITFTNKATEEIKKKADVEGVQQEFVAMTNDAFIEHEIIRPFITDTYGEAYKDDFTIDYTHNFPDFNSGKDTILHQSVLGVFQNIRKNFKFQLAYDILSNNPAACEYLQTKYEMLFLDEYQDSDLDMHRLFMYMKDTLKIKLFIVGDAKQAIYLWRGAQKNIFEMLEQDDVQHYELIKNFRSHDEIVNYANLIHNNDYFNTEYQLPATRLIHCKTNDFVTSFSKMVDSRDINLDEEITIIININNEAQECADALNNAGYNFQFIPRTPIDDNTPNSHLLHQLACYILDKDYSIYDLIESINADSRLQMRIRIEEIINVLVGNLEFSENLLFSTLNKLGDLLEIEFTIDELELLFRTLQNKEYHVAFIATENIHKVMTVFSSKGLEFNQVISFAEYYPMSSEEKRKNHYVCITRAEEKFIMIDRTDAYEEFIIEAAKKLGMNDSECLFKKIEHQSHEATNF